jgi:RHS repeat-associated protein
MEKSIKQNNVFKFRSILIIFALIGYVSLHSQYSALADEPVAADTAQTMECEFTSELVALAQELNNDPVEIYNWVYKNIKYDRYYTGSRMGAHTTYLNRRGNTYDISSLLITLLRISDIPARYVYRSGSSVFVEAWVPVDNYRGGGSGQSEGWAPLVPWNSTSTYKPGIDLFPDGNVPVELQFDFDNYVTSVNHKTALELYEEKVQEYLHTHHPGKTLKDIPITETTESGSAPFSSLLPRSLPRELSTSGHTTFSEIPYGHRNNITLKFKHTDNTLLLERTIYFPQIAGKRFCLDFIPADTNSQSIIAGYGGMCKTPLEANVYVKPVLKVDGVIMPAVTIDGVDIPEAIGSQILLGEKFYPEYTGAGYTDVTRPSKEAGAFMQMAFDTLAASEKTIEKVKMELETLSTDTAYDDSTREEYLGRMASVLMETFLLRRYELSTQIEDLTYGKNWRGNYAAPILIYTFPKDINKDKESKFYIHPQWNIDARGTGSFYKFDQNGQKTWLSWLDPVRVHARNLGMYGRSYNEGRIFEDWLDTPGLNTVKGLMLANEDTNNEVRVFTNTTDDINYLNGLKYRENFDVNTISGSQWTTIIEYLSDLGAYTPVPIPSQYDYIKNKYISGEWTFPIWAVDHILVDMDLILAEALPDHVVDWWISSIEDGATITAPIRMVDYEGMKGYVYIDIGDNYDGYMFNMDLGGANTNITDLDPTLVTYLDYTDLGLSTQISNGEKVDNRSAATNDSSSVLSVFTESDWYDIGAKTDDMGDPVDMVKGEYYQEENPDIRIKSRGLPLEITRTYKSQLIYNGPFGYGWAWNHAEEIIFSDDGSFVYYYDNKGVQYKLISQGDGTYEHPPGAMFTFEQKVDVGVTTYVVTQKRSGQTYHFTNQGFLYQKRDRFGNELNFAYTDSTYPNRITGITDSLGRAITLEYNANGKVIKTTDFTGRYCSYTYTGDDLTMFTDLGGNSTNYEYLSNQENVLNDHNMSKYILPNGDYLELGYYLNDQVSYHRNTEGATFNFQYSRLNQYAETWNEEGYYRKVFFNENNDVIRVANEDGTVEQKEYDEYHNLTKFIDGNGNTTMFVYYPAGQPEKAAERNLYSKTNELGGTWSYKYDSSNNPHAPSEVTDPVGVVTTFVYNADGSLQTKTSASDYAYDSDNKLIASTGAPGFTTTYNYDTYGNLLSTTDPLGVSTSGTYDTNGLYLTNSTDKNGNTTDYTYNESGASMPVGTLSSATLNSPTDSSGITTSYTYNHYNQKKTITDDLGNATTLSYDVNRKLLTRVLPDGATTTFTYYPARDIVSGALVKNEIDPLGNSVTFKYNKVGNVISREDRNGNITAYSYDGLNRLEEEVDPFQNSVKFSYDGNGNVTQQIDRNGNVTMFAYDAANRLVTKTDPEGNIFQYEYYADGKLKNEIYTVNSTLVTTHYDYNALGHPETRTVGYGSGDTRLFQYRYDALGRLVKTIYPKGNYETITYDNNGNTRYTRSFDSSDVQLRQVEYIYYADSRNLLQKKIVDNGKDDSGDGYLYEYDALGRLLKETDPVGNHVDYEYDSVGNLVTLTDGAGNITQHFYNLAGKRVKTIDANSNNSFITYDNNGNPLKVTDREGNETTAFYDAMNRRIGVMDALWNTTTFDYNENGNLIGLTDPNNGSTLYEYDGNNRQTKLTRPEGETTTFEYDPVGNRTAVLDANGQKITYEHDQFGQLEATKHYAVAGDTNPVKTVNFGYDDNGNLASYNDAETSATYAYDDLNRKTGETINYGSFSKNLVYDYPNNWEQTFTGPDNVTLTHKYDAAGRLNTITIPGQGDIAYSTYKWNSPTNITLPGGSSTDYTYDALWQVNAIAAVDPGSADIMTRNYVYTNEGNITTKDTEHGTYTYTYDELYRMTDAVNPTVTDETYTYDSLGNRLTSAAVTGNWAYNLNNELSSYGGTTLTYDNNGNITKKTIASVDTSYVYDETDRMEEVKDDNGVVIAAYYYDPFGRRLWKNTGSGMTYYLYSDEGLIGEYDSNGVEIKTYGYAIGSPWSSNPLFQKIGTDYYWYYNDHQGTPQKITDTTGTVVWSATYDSFGKTTIGTETITNNLRFPGQYYDTETGLHYNWNRYYDPETGRYMRVDPVSEGPNLYLYVQNNPLKYVDPKGLNTERVQNNTEDQQPSVDGDSSFVDGNTVQSSPEQTVLGEQQGTENKPWWKPDPGLFQRYNAAIDDNRLPFVKEFSPFVLPWSGVTAASSFVGAHFIEKAAVNAATRNFSSFSNTRNSAYVSGYNASTLKYAKVLRGVGVVSTIITVAAGSLDIGAGIFTIIDVWKGN